MHYTPISISPNEAQFLEHVNFKLMKSLESSEFLLIW